MPARIDLLRGFVVLVMWLSGMQRLPSLAVMPEIEPFSLKKQTV
jgi:hypothetical protein